MDKCNEARDSYAIRIAADVVDALEVSPPIFSKWSDSYTAFSNVVETPENLRSGKGGVASRAELAHSLNMILFARLLGDVGSAESYVEEQVAVGRRVFLDHGAVRTVAWKGTEALPQGRDLIARILHPLGYRQNKTYDLKRLKMTGFSYTHVDFPEIVGQWFVSEFHPAEFSAPFIEAVERTLSTAKDPLSKTDHNLLEKLSSDQRLAVDEAVELLTSVVNCFDRIHAMPSAADYETFLAESPEMAWISTEGSSCNHQTDRVENIASLAENERASGRPIKDVIEVSSSGRVKQTAHKAPNVFREFPLDANGHIGKNVPGSFFEFIQREYIEEEGSGRVLDLDFDAANAQGIFKMTRSH